MSGAARVVTLVLVSPAGRLAIMDGGDCAIGHPAAVSASIVKG